MAPTRPLRRRREGDGGRQREASGAGTSLGGGSGLPSAARLVRACTKCHERKVKCDGTLPRCAGCARAGAGTACDVAECVVWSHAHVVALDERVRWLEELVTRAYDTGDEGGIASCAPGTRLTPKRSFHSAPEHLPEETWRWLTPVGSMSGVTLGIIINSAIRLFQDEPLSVDTAAPCVPPPHTRAALPAAPIARVYVAQYIDSVHRWYPFLDLTRLGNDLATAYDPRGGTAALDEYARFVLFAILAIAAEQGVGGGSDGSGAPPVDAFTPAEYFRTALAFLPPVAAQGSVDTLRALLLATLYSQRSWDDHGLNLWQVTGHCMRLAVEMGLTRNNPKWDYGEKEQEARRRVFWSAYAFERFVAASTGRTVSVRREAIDAQLPQALDERVPSGLATFLQTPLGAVDLRCGVLLVRQRQLLGDILECVYQARAPGGPAPSADTTAARVFELQATLVEWAQEVYALQAGWTRDALLLSFHQATLWLHRPSPAFPSPTPDALDVCMGAARSSLRLRAAAFANGAHTRVFPGWDGFARIVTDGLTLMYCSWIGAQCPTAITSLAPDSMDAEVATSLALLESLSTRSPHAPRYIALYRQVILAFERILAQRQPLFTRQGAASGHTTPSGPIAATTVDIDTTLIAAALHNSGFASLTNVSLDEASIDYIARLLEGASGNGGEHL